MSLSSLAASLKQMYEFAPDGEQMAMIHLFGIRYAAEIKSSDFTPKDIVTAAGLKPSLYTELTKGIKLASYVSEKS